ncbi:MAG: hypothetical protein IJU03_03050 [Thermoguttaceae bacterium]|nr:hypothetical protein [Thermoguttaceae bacterium]
MKSIMIVNPDGSKVPVTREQLKEYAGSGVITRETNLELLGRIIPARKVKELVPIFESMEKRAEDRASEPNPVQPPDAVFPPPPFEDSPATPVPAKESTPMGANIPFSKSFFQRNFVDDAEGRDSISERAYARTKTMTAPFSLCRFLCLLGGVISVVVNLIYFISLLIAIIRAPYFDTADKVIGIIILAFTFLVGLAVALFFFYVFWGVFNYLVQYARQRAEDSIRQEDFYLDITRQIKELKENQ